MELRDWVLSELDDVTRRLRRQLLDVVPSERRVEPPDGGGNSIAWGLLHVARHADLALAAIEGVPATLALGGDGLDEVQVEGVALDGAREAQAVLATLLRTQALVAERLGTLELDRVADTTAALRSAGVPEDRYGWLYGPGMFGGQTVAGLIRWQLVGHVNNHVGEMLATRTRMGMSPW